MFPRFPSVLTSARSADDRACRPGASVRATSAAGFAVLAAVFAVLAPTPQARAADWFQFRGPGGQGHADGTVPTEWGEGKNLLWKVPLPGKGWSSPVVAAGRIYLTTAVQQPDGTHSLRALCLDAADGKIAWNTEVLVEPAGAPTPHQKNSRASPTPVVADGKVFVHFGHSGTAALDLKGAVLWKTTRYKYVPTHGNGGSPVVVDDLLIYSCDGLDKRFVVALKTADGSEAWLADRTDTVHTGKRTKFSFCTPVVHEADGRKQVIIPGTDNVWAYDAAKGTVVWRFKYDGYSVVPRPVIGHGMVFVCTGFGPLELIAIKLGGTGDITESHAAWRTRRGPPHTPSLLLVGDDLYGINDKGLATCWDAKTGKVHWTHRVGGNHSASPTLIDGKILFLSEEGAATWMAVGHVAKELGRNDLKESALASPAVLDGTLLVRTDKHLWRFGEKK